MPPSPAPRRRLRRHRSRAGVWVALAAAGLAVCALPAAGQVSHGGRPASELLLPSAPPTVWAEVAPETLAVLRAEDAAQVGGAFRYGALIPVSIGFEGAGAFDAAPDGSLVWRVRVASPGAFSVGLVFDRFELPVGGRLFVYDDARSVVLGAFDHQNNKANGRFQVRPVPGEALVVEYVQAPEVSALPELSIGTVVHDYRDLLGTVDPTGSSGGGGGGAGAPCYVDVMCPDANNFQDQRRAVAHVLSNGVQCSGALLNNTAQDSSQYFLTAEHCGDMTDAVFTFGYENPACGSGVAPTDKTVQGSELLVASDVQDYRLLEITEPIPASYGVFLAGWKRTSNAPSSTASISHPLGGPKKFARDLNTPLATSVYWAVTWEVGQVSDGSSGGPLFTGQGLVLGAASGIDVDECGQQTAFFSRLDLYWLALKPWLDPLSLSPSTLPGKDPEDDPPPLGPYVTSIAPRLVPAVGVDGFPTLVITGTGFLTVSGVSVAGVPLTTFPPQFTVVSDVRIDVTGWPYQDALGPVDVTVVSPLGSDTAQVVVEPNDPPVVQLAGSLSEGGFLFSAIGIDLTLGGEPGDFVVLAFSGSEVPSVLPGYFGYGIGNHFTSLFGLGTYVMPASGWVRIQAPVNGSLGGVKVHFQAAVLEWDWTELFPLTMTNVQSGQFLL